MRTLCPDADDLLRTSLGACLHHLRPQVISELHHPHLCCMLPERRCLKFSNQNKPLSGDGKAIALNLPSQLQR